MGEADSVVANNGNVIRYGQPQLADGVHAAEGGKVIREEDTGGTRKALITMSVLWTAVYRTALSRMSHSITGICLR